MLEGGASPSTGLTSADEMVLIHIGLFVLSTIGAGALSWATLRPYLQPYFLDAGFLVISAPGHVNLTMPWLHGRPVFMGAGHLVALAVGITALFAAKVSLARRRRLHLEGIRG